MVDNWQERYDAYRKHRKDGEGEKVIYAPSAYPRSKKKHIKEKGKDNDKNDNSRNQR